MKDTVVYIILILFLLVFLKNNISIEKKSINIVKHKDLDSKYAHFSEIDEVNYLKYPKLIFATPKKYTLKSGEALIIPSGWWHWIKTPVRTYSINFWIEQKMFREPKKINHVIKIDFSILNNEIVTVWNTKDEKKIYKNYFRDFLLKNKKNEYVITLENYNIFKENKIIKEKIKNQIKVPDVIKNINYDYNVWITSNQTDTGLHYDDEDGILCCLEGKKEIILYPPSDSQFLYPLTTRKWINSEALNCRYNSYTYYNSIKGLSSGRLLFEIIKHDENLLKIIDNFVSKNGINKTVWGLKNEQGYFRLEFYTYNLETKNDLVIESKDVFFKEPYIGKEKHYYYKFPDQFISLPFWGYGTYELHEKEYPESKIFVIDEYTSFNINYLNFMERLGYSNISEQFKHIIMEKYKCYEICVHNKKEGQIFVQYLGISKETFIEFLSENYYPELLVKYYSENEFFINNEIAIIYDIETKKIVRTGFYGIV